MGLRLAGEMTLTGRVTVIELHAITLQEVRRQERPNKTLLPGKRLLLELLFGQHSHFVQYLALGDNAMPAALTDPGLYNELLRGPLTSVSLDDDSTNGLATVRYILGSTMGNGNTYREAGLFNDNNVCYARSVFADVVKNDSKILILQWDLTAA
jgi:hypothetical protein